MFTSSKQDFVMGNFPQLSGSGEVCCRYGFFSRHGGKSAGNYNSLNVGLHVGDDESVVHVNREIVKKKIGALSLLSALQVHGTKVHVQNELLAKDVEVDGYDALVTNQQGVALMVQHADCQAVLLYDAVAGVIAGVHNGWRGSVQNILAKVVAVMSRDYFSNPGDIQAVVGPSLGPCCAEFRNYQSELPEEFLQFKGHDSHFDFWSLTKKQLFQEGLQEENITISGQCTRCSTDYFSYRKAVQTGTGITGRNGSVIVMRER
ncbi:MAG: YfiH family protein [Desulforhopalus sp.]|jgi:YfiH family protein